MRIKGYILGGISGLTWGLDAVLIGIILSLTIFQSDPLLLVGGALVCSLLHDLFAAIWLTVILGFTGKLRSLWKTIFCRDTLYCMLGALFGGPLAMSCYLLSINEGNPAVTATVTASYPLIGTLLAVLVLRERVHKLSWIGLLICIAGLISLVFSDAGSSSVFTWKGIAFALVAALGWALESVVCAYGMREGKIEPEIALLVREITSALTYIILVLPWVVGGYSGLFGSVGLIATDLNAISLLIITALVGMLSFFSWYASIESIGAARALCLNVTYSFWTIAFAYFLLQQPLSLHVIISAICIVVGVSFSILLNRFSN